MRSSATSRWAVLFGVASLSIAIAPGPVLAQTQPMSPTGNSLSLGEKPEKSVEGAVKKVDPAVHTVRVSTGLFGIMGRTLEVNDRTIIQVEGRQGTLADIREGSKVKAAFETRDGKDIATQIDVMPASSDISARSNTPRSPR